VPLLSAKRRAVSMQWKHHSLLILRNSSPKHVHGRSVFIIINRLLMLAFEDPDIMISAQCSYGTAQNFYTAIKGKQPNTFMSSVGMLHSCYSHVAYTVQETLHSMCWGLLGVLPPQKNSEGP
jgi:hypothetical protein